MSEIIEIEDYEDKETNAGKAYTKFKTSQGWLCCFDRKSIEELKKAKGKSVNVVLKESGDFKNIKKFVSMEDGLAKEEKKEENKSTTQVSTSRKKEMYVSYAKDCFCAIVGRISQSKFDDMEESEVEKLMDLAIKVVKKAEEKLN